MVYQFVYNITRI